MRVFEKIIILFTFWRLLLLLTAAAAIAFLPLAGNNYLGGGYDNYINLPILYSWANFDGEHYLSISLYGYQRLQHAFFPLYPLMIYLIGKIINIFSSFTTINFLIIGMLISNLSFLLALKIFYKLLRLDYNEGLSFLVISILLIFPTSYYFASLYTESLYLLLSIGCFYFARQRKWFLSSILGILATATRIVGIFLLLGLLIEWLKDKKLANLLKISFIPVGMLVYLFYLELSTGSALSFYNELATFGDQRGGNFILLPQVFYRYFNILSSTPISAYTFFVALFELATAILIILTLILGYKMNIRRSYLLYSLCSFLLPTLTGSFSSIPRYVLVIFPVFIILADILYKVPRTVRIATLCLSSIILVILTSLFLRGYWIA